MARSYRVPASSSSSSGRYKSPDRRPAQPANFLNKDYNSNMMDSVVQGVSQLTMCSDTPITLEAIFGKPFWDDESHATASTLQETVCQSNNSFSDGSPLPPSRIGQARALSSSSHTCTAAAPPASPGLADPPPLTSVATGTYSESFSKWNKAMQAQSKLYYQEQQTHNVPYPQQQSKAQSVQQQQALQQHQNHTGEPQTKRPSTSSSISIPATAIDLDDDDDIMSYDSQQLAACWDDVDSDEEAGYIFDEDDDDNEFSHQMEGYQDGARFSPNAHNNGKDDKKYSSDNDEPPLAAQTSYARQQLLQSSRYRAMQQQQQQHDVHDLLLVDEIEISRGLGGYEEGFGVPTMIHEFHQIPFKINEDPEEGDISSSDGEVSSVGTTEVETLTYYDGDINSNINNNSMGKDVTRNGSVGMTSTTDSVCFHCSQGTCDNEDCSGSRFMI